MNVACAESLVPLLPGPVVVKRPIAVEPCPLYGGLFPSVAEARTRPNL
jgi:hypothetical protein